MLTFCVFSGFSIFVVALFLALDLAAIEEALGDFLFVLGLEETVLLDDFVELLTLDLLTLFLDRVLGLVVAIALLVLDDVLTLLVVVLVALLALLLGNAFCEGVFVLVSAMGVFVVPVRLSEDSADIAAVAITEVLADSGFPWTTGISLSELFTIVFSGLATAKSASLLLLLLTSF